MLVRQDLTWPQRAVPEHFREPDLNDQKTAIAVDPSADGRLFHELPLL
jgi:hypothetical protein